MDDLKKITESAMPKISKEPHQEKQTDGKIYFIAVFILAALAIIINWLAATLMFLAGFIVVSVEKQLREKSTNIETFGEFRKICKSMFIRPKK